MSSRAQVALVAIGAVVLVAVVAGAAVVVTSSGSSSSPKPIAVAPAVQRFPNPPAGAFVTARADGSDVLALAVVPHPGRVALQVSDVTQNGDGARGLRVSFAVTSGATRPGCGTTASASGRPHGPSRMLRPVVGKPLHTPRERSGGEAYCSWQLLQRDTTGAPMAANDRAAIVIYNYRAALPTVHNERLRRNDWPAQAHRAEASSSGRPAEDVVIGNASRSGSSPRSRAASDDSRQRLCQR